MTSDFAVWTGSLANGIQDLGTGGVFGLAHTLGDNSLAIRFGSARMSDSSWMAYSIESPATQNHLYAISAVLTAFPEPSTGLLVIAGLLGLAGWNRSRVMSELR